MRVAALTSMRDTPILRRGKPGVEGHSEDFQAGARAVPRERLRQGRLRGVVHDHHAADLRADAVECTLQRLQFGPIRDEHRADAAPGIHWRSSRLIDSAVRVRPPASYALRDPIISCRPAR